MRVLPASSVLSLDLRRRRRSASSLSTGESGHLRLRRSSVIIIQTKVDIKNTNKRLPASKGAALELRV